MLQKLFSSKLLFILTSLFLCFLLLYVYISYGKLKSGFEGDEIFSYISSNAPDGGYKRVTDFKNQTWYDGTYFSESMSAVKGRQFEYNIPIENQLTDVHPPLYYILLHTVCSFSPGVFSPWFGIGINIFFAFLTLFTLFFLIRFNISGRYFPLILTFLFGLNTRFISNILFVRMYTMLTLLFTLSLLYHMILMHQSLTKKSLSFIRWCPLYFIALIGTMTHYYFLIFLLFLSAVSVFILLFIQKNLKLLFQYIITLCISGLSSILIYPNMLRHIFSGYRGREAMHKFFDFNDYLKNIFSMFQKVNTNMMNNKLWILLIIIILLLLGLTVNKKFNKKNVVLQILFIFPIIFYIMIITKIAPYLIDRYISPVHAILYGTIFSVIVILLKNNFLNIEYKKITALLIICTSLFLAIISNNLSSKTIYTTYEKYNEKATMLKPYYNTNIPVIYISPENYHWKMWEEFPFFMSFNRIFYLDGSLLSPITDIDILTSTSVILYIEEGLSEETILNYLSKYTKLDTLDFIANSMYSKIYIASHAG